MRLKHLIVSLTLLLFLLSGCAYKNHMKQGDLLYSQGNYEAALNQYEAALAKKPRSEDAMDGVDSAKAALIGQLSEETRLLLDAGDYSKALSAAFALENRLPDSPPVQELLREVSTRLQNEGITASERGQWAKALDYFMMTYDAFPEDRDTLDPKIQEVKTTWTAELTNAANNAEAAGNLGDALLLHSQASLLSMAAENVSKRDELRARLITDFSYPIYVKGKGSGAGKVVSSLLNRAGFSQNMSFHNTSKGISEAATMSIALKRPSFTTERTRSSRTVQYISGTRQVENPQYVDRMRDLEREENDLFRYQDDVSQAQRDVDRYSDQVAREGDTPNTSTGAEQSLSRARSELERGRDNVDRARDRVQRATESMRRTPQTIEEDVYSDLEYTVTTHRRIGELPANVIITHRDKDRQKIETSFIAGTSAQDDTHDAYPIADVPEDPLRLPSDPSLETTMQTQIAVNLFSLADQSFQERRQQVLEQGFAQEDLGKRLHFYVIYILMDPSRVDDRIIEEISTARGIPNAPEIISQSK